MNQSFNLDIFYLKYLLFFGLIIISSCESQYDMSKEVSLVLIEDGQLLNDKIINNNIGNKSAVPLKHDNGCFPESYGLNCESNIELFFVTADITDCIGGLTEDCVVSGEMEVTICETSDAEGNLINVEVIFREETLYGHATDCIIDPVAHGGEHLEDCESEAAYNAFIADYMPDLISLYEAVGVLNLDKILFQSNYVKELCVTSCLEILGGQWVMRYEQCGESFACCITKDRWFKDENGNTQNENISRIKIGECSEGFPKCGKGGSPEFSCSPRNCSNS